MEGIGLHRPRNVDWKRAAGLLYGDWGTSKAYVIGLAFTCPFAAAGGYHALPVILAVSGLTALVAYNYVVVCKHFPDGGGVYSAARGQSRILAVMGALLLVANFSVTAAMSGWAAMSYFGVPRPLVAYATVAVITGIGVLNFFGPKHTGSLAVTLAVPMVVLVMIVIGLSIPDLTLAHLQPMQGRTLDFWKAFAWSILALSGVEAVANLTGVMKLDPGSTLENPRVAMTSRWSILPVAVEVVLGTSLLGWAMLSLDPAVYGEAMKQRWEDMLRFLAEVYGQNRVSAGFGSYFGLGVGLVVGLLLLSAVNTAISALIGLIYMMARDGEMPRPFVRLNRFGVPWITMVVAVVIPILTVVLTNDLGALAGLYAIGVVGAITVNLGSCTFNRQLPLRIYERLIMGGTFVILFLVELTIAKTRGDALFFACCVLGLGLGLRGYAQRRAGLRTLTVSEQVAAHVAPETAPDFRINLKPGQNILVAARGITPVLGFALEEARLRQGSLYVLYVKELAVSLPGTLENAGHARWQNDPQASRIMYSMMEQGREAGVPVIPVYVVSESPAATILDLSATLGIDTLVLGSPHRSRLVSLLKGNVVSEVARDLPENIRLIIFG